MELPIIKTQVAQVGFNDHRFRGKSVFNDLVGHSNLTEIIALSISKHSLQADDIDMLNDIAAVMTIADPHIWPLKISRMAAGYGSFLQGVAAGLVSVQEMFIGPATCNTTAQMLVEFGEKLGDTFSPSQVESLLRIYCTKQEGHSGYQGLPKGFGIPFKDFDDRLVVLESCVQKRNKHNHRFWRLLLAIKEVSAQKFSMVPNIYLGSPAVLLDLGFRAEDASALIVSLIHATFTSNAIEAVREPQPVLRELPGEFIEYVGREDRVSPRDSI
ncbi:hypothetical protein [Moorena sp. SIO3I6]|uniref:hypothetical protein n=1 Tax=Moorena sp. SIO3I6 TaxID=2607831 RepID=UPI0013F7AB04|nr:hypothetical protein [Moorena sp. SIO3I6]NEP23125.1 hypothetical protein [Moorena sp. SIO3I6]